MAEREIVEMDFLTCTGSSLGEVVRWARAVGAPLDDVAIETYRITDRIYGVAAVWYGSVETVEPPPELL